ncbi:MAG: hypothetical protein ABSC18_13820 [Verrucomicrobiota bacterium]|jgi:hypothetical protein
MNRLILDYFRRWWRVLALCGALEFGLGAFIASHAKENFEFWGLLIALWAGANLLLMDLKNGMARSVAVLPLTMKQIGRGWWLATVGIPAVALAALLFFGAGTFYYFHPRQVLPADRLGMAGLFNVAWLVVVFICSSAAPGVEGKGWRRARTVVLNLLAAITLLVGMLYFQNAAGKPIKRALLLGIGALLTVESWVRAERFVLGRAGFRLATPQFKGARGQPGAADESLRRLEAHRPPATAWWGLRRRLFDRYLRWVEGMAGRNPRGEHHAPGGYGGIPLLIRTIFVRTFLTGAALLVLMTLSFMAVQSPLHSQIPGGLISLFPFMFLFLVVFMQPTPALRQLRFLRTLPVSATRLAGVMISMLILPIIAVGALTAGVTGLALGGPAAIGVLKGFTFMLAPAALCIFFHVWRGGGTPMNILLLLTLFGFQMAPLWLQGILHHPNIPFVQTGAFVGLCVLLAFLLTRRAIQRSRHAYLVPANQFSHWL